MAVRNPLRNCQTKTGSHLFNDKNQKQTVRAIFSPLILFKLCEENIKNLIVSIKFILYNKERNYHD